MKTKVVVHISPSAVQARENFVGMIQNLDLINYTSYKISRSAMMIEVDNTIYRFIVMNQCSGSDILRGIRADRVIVDDIQHVTPEQHVVLSIITS